jgi:hypothetical protein
MTCLLCNEPFKEKKTTTLGCGHEFHSVCLRQDLYNRYENLDECVCPLCLKPYQYTVLIFEDLPPNSRIQRDRIFEINKMVIEKAHELDKNNGRTNKENPSRPTKESMDEAKLMCKQNIKQQEQRQKEEQEELILQQKAVIQHQEELIVQLKSDIQQKEELILELKAVIKQKEEQNEEQEELIVQKNAIIQELSRQPQQPNRRVF